MSTGNIGHHFSVKFNSAYLLNTSCLVAPQTQRSEVPGESMIPKDSSHKLQVPFWQNWVTSHKSKPKCILFWDLPQLPKYRYSLLWLSFSWHSKFPYWWSFWKFTKVTLDSFRCQDGCLEAKLWTAFYDLYRFTSRRAGPLSSHLPYTSEYWFN